MYLHLPRTHRGTQTVKFPGTWVAATVTPSNKVSPRPLVCGARCRRRISLTTALK